MSKTKELKVLHFSSHGEDCGVGKYQENYLVGMEGLDGVYNKFFEVSPYRTREMSPAELHDTMNDLTKELADYDILHVQHEFGLYRFDEFRQVVLAGMRAGKKVIVTVHLSPSDPIKPAKLGGLSPRNIVGYLRKARHYRRMVKNHVEPMRWANTVIAHSDQTIKDLKNFEIDPSRIKKLPHPVYAVPKPPTSDEITKNLNKKRGDIVYCTVGFLHRFKGVEAAIRALKFLPDNYKLAVVGGMHPLSDSVSLYDKICNLIDWLGLRERVYITGYVKDDDRLNALIRECDVCVYPYDRIFYSHQSSGSFNLAFANDRPVIAYPTVGFKELAAEANGAVVLCDTFAYYELARELKHLNIPKQIELSKVYAEKNAWPKAAKELVQIYHQTTGR